MFQVLAATNNRHKLEEYRNLLKGKDVEIKCPADYKGFPETEENGNSFRENAEKKALAANEFIDMPAFADDSGLEVEALNGAPGVHSSRYAENDEKRIAKLLKELKGVKNRRARFVCVISIANKGEIIESFEGEVKGNIIDEARGTQGFGYDPIFVPDGYDKTFSELGPEIKDRISHRAKAAQLAIEFIEDELSSIDDL